MLRQCFLWTATLLVFGAAAICEGQESTQTGKCFRVVCHFENDRVASEALKTAERVWPVATRFLAKTGSAPEKPLDIHLFRKMEDYEKVDTRLTGGAFRRNLAFSHPGTRAAYILLQPPCSDDALKAVKLPALTRRLIAHEATHLVRYATMPNHPSHPHWLADGLATWVEQKVMIEGGWSPCAEDDPNASTSMLRTVELLDAGECPSVDDILHDRMEHVPWGTCYGTRWLLLRFLKDTLPPETFRSIMHKAAQLGGGSDYTQHLNGFIRQTLGDDTMKSIDGKFRAYLRALKPQWDEAFRSLDTAGDTWSQIAFSDKNAIAWRTKPVEKGAYTLKGELKIVPGQSQQLNLLLGRRCDGLISVAFTAGYGVTVFHYHERDNRWENLGSSQSDLLLPDHRVRFLVKVANDKVHVTLNKTPILTAPLNGRSMSGPWGLGAQSGSAGMWRKVSLN